MNDSIRGQLVRVRNVPAFERMSAHIRTLSIGDRIIFYGLTALVMGISLFSFYSLEQSILVEVPAYGGIIKEGVVGSPRFIHPLLAISDADRDLSALTYAGLMGISGAGELVPVLAEKYTISDDEKTYTFTLRKDTVFSDGTPVTANDVVFTVQKAQNPAIKSPRYADWAGVQVSFVDQQTVRFVLTKPYAPFLGLTTLGILPSTLWKNISDSEFQLSSLQTNPIGAGPFKIDEVSRGKTGLIESVSLIKNKHYLLGRPYLDGINFTFYSRTEDLANALKNGLIESGYDLPALGKENKILTAPYNRIFGVFFNPSGKQIFSRIEIRKALSIALDRKNIIDTALGGYATAIIGPVPPGGLTQQKISVPQFINHPAAAKEVLQSAGWKYDESARAWILKGSIKKDTKVSGAKTDTTTKVAEMKLDTITIRTSNAPELKSVAHAVKADWEKLGITVNTELYEQGDLSQNVIRPRKYEALLYGMVIGRDQDLYAFWDSKNRNDPGLNIAQYTNKAVDDLLLKIRSSTNKETRRASLEKIQETIANEYPAAFIYEPNFTYVVPKDLKNVTLPQIIIPADRFATVASWYRSTDTVWPIFAGRE